MAALRGPIHVGALRRCTHPVSMRRAAEGGSRWSIAFNLPPNRASTRLPFSVRDPRRRLTPALGFDLLITLQRSAGNAAVTGLLQSRGASRSNQSVQRYGPMPRDFSDDERLEHSTESDNRVQAVTLQRGPHDDNGDSAEEDPPPGGLSDEPSAEVPAGPINAGPSGASGGGDAGVPAADAGSDKPASGGRDAPRPVGFGQDQPETYEPAFMKDALPDVGKVLRALASTVGWMTIYHVAKEASRKNSLSDVLQVIIAGGLLGGLLRDDAVAEILPQSWLIALAQREVSSKGPLARQHLDHYLAGTGSNFVEDIAKLYGDDAGFERVGDSDPERG